MVPNDSRQTFTALRAIVFATAFVSLWAALGLAVRRFDGVANLTIPHWLMPIGIGIAAAGAILVLACIIVFVTRGRGTPAPFDPPREFVVFYEEPTLEQTFGESYRAYRREVSRWGVRVARSAMTER